ncbi:MAG TPA: hypothetical protein VLD37_02245 [Candidatus Bilamarchaeum sp.]|nr:hypothetical protein [Candidatus Bilamarchaeum sp.]
MIKEKIPAPDSLPRPAKEFGKAAAQAGPERISVPSHLHDDFFAFLRLVRQEGGAPLNELAYAYLETVSQGQKSIGEREFAALYRLSLRHGPPLLREALDRKFVLDKGMVSARQESLLKGLHAGYNWPATVDHDD